MRAGWDKGVVALPLQSVAGLLQNSQLTQRPHRIPHREDLRNKLALPHLDWPPTLTAVLAHQQLIVRRNPHAVAPIERYRREPALRGALLRFPGHTSVLAVQQLAGEPGGPTILQVAKANRRQRPRSRSGLHQLPGLAAVLRAQDRPRPAHCPPVVPLSCLLHVRPPSVECSRVPSNPPTQTRLPSARPPTGVRWCPWSAVAMSWRHHRWRATCRTRLQIGRAHV